jgi:hypothetical protein
MNWLKKIICISLLSASFFSCKDDNVPGLDKTPVSKEKLLGGWEIVSTRPYVNVNPAVKPLIAGLNLDKKLEDKLNSKAEGISFYFKEDSVYFFRDEILKSKCKYFLSEYVIELEDPYLIGFYAPYYYIKMEGEILVMYLRKSETLDLLEKDGSISSFDMGLIRQAVEDAQCELRFSRKDLSTYEEIHSSDF